MGMRLEWGRILILRLDLVPLLVSHLSQTHHRPLRLQTVVDWEQQLPMVQAVLRLVQQALAFWAPEER